MIDDATAARYELAEMERLDLAGAMERDRWVATGRDRDTVTMEREGRRIEVTQPFGGRGHWREVGLPPARRDILDYEAMERGGSRNDARGRIRPHLAPEQRIDAHLGKPALSMDLERQADLRARSEALTRAAAQKQHRDTIARRSEEEARRRRNLDDAARSAETKRRGDRELLSQATELERRRQATERQGAEHRQSLDRGSEAHDRSNDTAERAPENLRELKLELRLDPPVICADPETGLAPDFERWAYRGHPPGKSEGLSEVRERFEKTKEPNLEHDPSIKREMTA